MGRWQPDSHGRLQEAALALFSERGFDQTTTAEIADRAGLTERTFFRHFTDKREVLFGGSALLQEQIVAGVTSAPPADGPLDAVSPGLDAAAAKLGASRRDLAASARPSSPPTPSCASVNGPSWPTKPRRSRPPWASGECPSRRRPWPPRPA
jgi:AcrR family transcriptional regulator